MTDLMPGQRIEMFVNSDRISIAAKTPSKVAESPKKSETPKTYFGGKSTTKTPASAAKSTETKKTEQPKSEEKKGRKKTGKN